MRTRMKPVGALKLSAHGKSKIKTRKRRAFCGPDTVHLMHTRRKATIELAPPAVSSRGEAHSMPYVCACQPVDLCGGGKRITTANGRHIGPEGTKHTHDKTREETHSPFRATEVGATNPEASETRHKATSTTNALKAMI